MSRIGRAPITIPAGVTVDVDANNKVVVKGPKGTLSREIRPEMKITVEGNVLTVTRPSDNRLHRSLHGLSRTLINKPKDLKKILRSTASVIVQLKLEKISILHWDSRIQLLSSRLKESHSKFHRQPQFKSSESIKNWLEQLPQRFAVIANLNLIKARESNTPASISVARKVKLARKVKNNFEGSELRCSKSRIRINCGRNAIKESAITSTERQNVLVSTSSGVCRTFMLKLSTMIMASRSLRRVPKIKTSRAMAEMSQRLNWSASLSLKKLSKRESQPSFSIAADISITDALLL